MKVRARTRGDKERKGLCLANTKERKMAQGTLGEWSMSELTNKWECFENFCKYLYYIAEKVWEISINLLNIWSRTIRSLTFQFWCLVFQLFVSNLYWFSNLLISIDTSLIFFIIILKNRIKAFIAIECQILMICKAFLQFLIHVL